jgi:diguanylate cyclase (GGDEF)-like protein
MAVTHAKREHIVTLIDRIRKELGETEFHFRGRPTRVTASFGIAGLEGNEAPDFARILARADAALYSAKGSGRNRIEIAPVS